MRPRISREILLRLVNDFIQLFQEYSLHPCLFSDLAILPFPDSYSNWPFRLAFLTFHGAFETHHDIVFLPLYCWVVCLFTCRRTISSCWWLWMKDFIVSCPNQGAVESAGRHGKYVETRGAAWDCARWREYSCSVSHMMWSGFLRALQCTQYLLMDLWHWRVKWLVYLNKKIPSNVGWFRYLFMFVFEFSGFLMWPEILLQNYHCQLFKE